MLAIKETVFESIRGSEFEGHLTKGAHDVSKKLKHRLGIGEWQVIFIRGPHVKKLACSRAYFCVLRKKDGLFGYVWVNRFVRQF